MTLRYPVEVRPEMASEPLNDSPDCADIQRTAGQAAQGVDVLPDPTGVVCLTVGAPIASTDHFVAATLTRDSHTVYEVTLTWPAPQEAALESYSAAHNSQRDPNDQAATIVYVVQGHVVTDPTISGPFHGPASIGAGFDFPTSETLFDKLVPR